MIWTTPFSVLPHSIYTSDRRSRPYAGTTLGNRLNGGHALDGTGYFHGCRNGLIWDVQLRESALR